VRDDHTELTRAGIPTHSEAGERYTKDERLLIWTVREHGADYVYRIFELAGEVSVGRMTTREAFEEMLFNYTPPTVATTRREQ
jgi:hypothetical protein